jgi:sugar/nucleoside kinase (ribokinase family)
MIRVNHADKSPIKYLTIGHVTRDVNVDSNGSRNEAVGGTTVYSAFTAKRLGFSPAIITAAEPSEVERASKEYELPIYNHPSEHTTTFENTYDAEHNRHQKIRPQTADRLTWDDVEQARKQMDLDHVRIVHLGPVAQELDAGLVKACRKLPSAPVIAITPQGWLRGWDGNGKVGHKPWDDAVAVIQDADVLILSPEDVAYDWELIHTYARAPRLLSVVTLERHGALVIPRNEEVRWIPPRRPRDDRGSTGAGDVFAAAFLTAFSEMKDSMKAAGVGNLTASYLIEKGLHGIPDGERIMGKHRCFDSI